MMRFICRETDIGAACHVGGPVSITHKTFTDAAKCEAWAREKISLTTREIIGVELVDEVSIPADEKGEGA